MGRQRNRPQMKEQESSPEEELNKMDVSNLSDIEFKVMIIRTLNSMKKDIEMIKRTSHKNKAIFEINNRLEGINSWLDEAENKISNLEDKVEKYTQ